jgi:hypothetical protein
LPRTGQGTQQKKLQRTWQPPSVTHPFTLGDIDRVSVSVVALLHSPAYLVIVTRNDDLRRTKDQSNHQNRKGK